MPFHNLLDCFKGPISDRSNNVTIVFSGEKDTLMDRPDASFRAETKNIGVEQKRRLVYWYSSPC